jgi:hypothetical protein
MCNGGTLGPQRNRGGRLGILSSLPQVITPLVLRFGTRRHPVYLSPSWTPKRSIVWKQTDSPYELLIACFPVKQLEFSDQTEIESNRQFGFILEFQGNVTTFHLIRDADRLKYFSTDT